jgi:hypothetical protein
LKINDNLFGIVIYSLYLYIHKPVTLPVTQ